jgi:lysophospholipase L1-like esterase
VVDDESYEEAAYYACPKSGIISVETDDGYHTVRVYKRSEGQWSRVKITGVYTNGYFVENRESSERLIEVFGDSITAGYGNRRIGTGFYTKDQDGLATYAFLAAQELDAEVSVVAASGKAINMNIWESNLKLPDLLDYTTFTNTAPYVPARIPQVVVINGGANDAPYINQATNGTDRKVREDAFVEAYVQFLQAIAEKYEGTTILCCTDMMGEGSVIEPLIQEAISQAMVENVHLLTLPSIYQDGTFGADGHPTVVTHQKAAIVLEEKIREIMGW